ncbi:hypothetical protein SRHO_G00080790 [Serrasalmus rhombeus]
MSLSEEHSCILQSHLGILVQQNGKRKVRGANGTCCSSKKRERKTAEESGTLPSPSKHLQALDVALQLSSFLPPIKGSSPPPRTMKDNWMEKGLDLYDEPAPPSAVQRETTPEEPSTFCSVLGF